MGFGNRRSSFSLTRVSSEEGEEHCLRNFCATHIKTIVTLVMILATILVIVLIVFAHKWSYEKEQQALAEACLDVAIVGGGLSGTYTAWRLRERGLRVQIFELSNRLGGRMYTTTFPHLENVHAELGAMYYLPQQHRLLNRTIHALGLKVKSPTMFSDDTDFFLRGTRLTTKNMKEFDDVPYNLDTFERRRYPDQLKKDYLLKSVEHSENPLRAETSDGRYLYEKGYWNWLGRVASDEGYSFLYDTALLRSTMGNGNAAILATMDSDSLHLERSTLKDGMQRLPEKLAEEFEAASERHKVSLNHRIEGIRAWIEGLFKIKVVKSCTIDERTFDLPKKEEWEICARKVVLALPPYALKKLRWSYLQNNTLLKRRLDSVHEIPAIKMYFVYRRDHGQSWWEKYSKHFTNVITDSPLRRVSVIGTGGVDDEFVLLLVAFTDDRDVEYWRELYHSTTHPGSLKSQSNVNVTRGMVADVHKHLQTIFNLHAGAIPEPEAALIQDWSGAPYGAAWHIWKPGIDYQQMFENILQPICDEQVFIVGSAFCPGDCQMYAEGALQTVDDLIRTYL